MYFTFSEHNRTFQSLGVWRPGTSNVTGFAQPEEVHAANMTDGVLETLNDPPLLAARSRLSIRIQKMQITSC